MNSYVIHVNNGCRVFGFAEGFVVADPGWYVLMTAENSGALLDLAGPFDEEEDAELCRIRCEEIAA